jgi:hypothetical protein
MDPIDQKSNIFYIVILFYKTGLINPVFCMTSALNLPNFYSAIPPADPCQQGFFQKEFLTEQEALEYVLARQESGS